MKFFQFCACVYLRHPTESFSNIAENVAVTTNDRFLPQFVDKLTFNFYFSSISERSAFWNYLKEKKKHWKQVNGYDDPHSIRFL